MRTPKTTGAPALRTAPKTIADPGRGRSVMYLLVVFIACVLIVDALAGEKGLLETMRARRQYSQLASAIDGLRQENARLREEARRLREDPRTVEAIARQELGLIRPGEVLFIIKDVSSPSLPR